MAITILYFAWVRERTGRSEEDLELPTGVRTVRELIQYLVARGGGYAEAFAEDERLRAAVNQDHVDFDHPVRDGDEIAFFPPVTGG